MAQAQIIDLDEVRRARRAAPSQAPAMMPMSPADQGPLWCYYWMPVMYWYVP